MRKLTHISLRIPTATKAKLVHRAKTEGHGSMALIVRHALAIYFEDKSFRRVVRSL